VELAGRVVLVTGASRGHRRGHLRGADPARGGGGRRGTGPDALAEVAASSTVVADAADPAAAPALVAAAVDRHGRLDAVVANAGLGWAGEFAAMDPARITELVDVNLRAPMLLARAALPVLRRPGALVFVTSIAGLVGVPGETVYSVTKAGLETFATLLREETDGRDRVDGRPGRGRHGLLRRPRRPVRPALPAAGSRPPGRRGGGRGDRDRPRAPRSSRAGWRSRPGCRQPPRRPTARWPAGSAEPSGPMAGRYAMTPAARIVSRSEPIVAEHGRRLVPAVRHAVRAPRVRAPAVRVPVGGLDQLLVRLA
jgi:hypothetical protein